MKTTKFFFCGLMTVAMLAVSSVVSAQEKSNKEKRTENTRNAFFISGLQEKERT